MRCPGFGARPRQFCPAIFLVAPLLAAPTPAQALCFGDDPACLVDELRLETQRDMQLVERRLNFHGLGVDRLLAMIDGLMDRLDAQDQQIERREAGVSRLSVKRL